MPIVSVPSLGDVEFPDGLSNEEMERAIRQRLSGQEQEPSPPTDSYLGHLGGQVQKGYLEADATAQMGVAPALTPKQGPPVGITEGNTYPGLLPGMPTTIGTQVQAPVAPDSALAQPYEQRVKEGPYWKAAQESQRRAVEIPENPEWTDTYASKVAKGLGGVAQMGATGVALAPFVGAPLAGLAGPATMVELGAMTAGVMGGAGEQIQQGVAEGKKIEELDWPYLLGGALGTTEVAPIDLAFRFFKKYGEKNILARIGILAATGALSEGIQEGLQQVGSNLIAKHNYKPDQDIWEGVSDSFLVAMGIGGLLGGAAGAIPRAKTKGKVDVPPSDFSDEFIGPLPPPPPEAPVGAPTGPLPEIKQLSQTEMAKSNAAIEAQTAGSLPAQVDTRTYPNLTVEGAPLPYEPATVTPQVGTSATPTVGQESAPEVGRVPPPLLTNHPVQTALQEEFGDAGSAAHFADTEGPRLGVSFHPVETRPGVWQVRMGKPKLEQVGSEYESFLDDLNNAEGEAQGASKQLLGRMRANVAKNKAAYDLAEGGPFEQNLDEKSIQAEPTEPTVPPTVLEGPKLGREARLQALREAASRRLGANRPAVPSAEQDVLLGKTKHLKFKPESVEEQKQLQEMLGKQAELLEADVQRATRDNKKISTAVLAQAVDDIQAGGDAAADARRWLNERGKTDPFSFDSVVDTLGLDGEAIKEAIETGKADPEAMRDTIKLYSGLGFMEDIGKNVKLWTSALHNFVSKSGTKGFPSLPKLMDPDEVPKLLDQHAGKMFKVEELMDTMRLTGLKGWLQDYKEQGRKVTKEDLADYLATDGIQVEERWYGANSLSPSEHREFRMLENFNEMGNMSPEQETRYRELFAKAGQVSAKYENTSNYNLSGLREGYFELVLTSPQAREMAEDPSHFIEGQGKKQIGWVRGDWRTDAEGKKVLFIEEVQSKRHQEGREKGYAQPLKELPKGWTVEENYITEENGIYNTWLIRNERGEFMGAEPRGPGFDRENAIEAYLDRSKRGGVSDAPFRQSWLRLISRRLLRYAAENNADSIAWTTGEQQAERWSLRQVAEELSYDASNKELTTYNDGLPDQTRVVNEEELPSYVGQELAKQLLDKRSISREDHAKAALRAYEESIQEGVATGAYTAKEADEYMRYAQSDPLGFIPREIRDSVVNPRVTVPEGIDFYSSKWPEKIYGFERGGYKKGLMYSAMQEAMKPFKGGLGEVVGGKRGAFDPALDKAYLDLMNTEDPMQREVLKQQIRELEALPPTVSKLDEFSKQPAVHLTPEMKDHFASNPFNLYSGLGWIPESLNTLKEMGRALLGRKGASLPGGGGATWLSRRADEHIVLPQWVAKINEKYKAFYDNASSRLAKQTADISAALEQIGIWRKLSLESRTRMVDFVNQIRDKKLKATPSPEIETYTEGDLTKVRRVEKHMDEFEAYCKSKGLSDDEVNFMVGWKTGLNDAFVTRYNRLAEMRNIDPNTLSEMLNNEGFISNYFPHMWNQKSSYYTIGSKDGKTVAHVPLPVGFGQRVLGKHLLYNKFVEGLKKNPAFEGLEWSQPQSVREHERYWLNSPVPIDTMSRLLDEAAKRLEGNEELAPLAKAFRSQIPAEVAQIMKTRYQGNFAHRRGILGFETQDITKVYFDYISHTYSNLSKMEASKEYTNLMFKTKPSSEDFKLFADFVQDEMSPYGQFEKWMDGFRSLLFARYLGLRLKPAALNLTNMTTASIPMLGIYTKGAASSAKLHGESMKDIAKQWRSEFPTHRRVTGIQGAAVQNTLSPYEIRAQIDSYTDSTIQAQMMREYRGEFKDQNSLTQKAMQVLGRPMEMTEWYMRASTLNAALRAVERGLITHSETLQKYGWEQGEKVDLSVEDNYQKALDFAQDVVNSSYADYTHFNKPPMIRSGKAGAALRTAYTFRLFNQHLMHMWSWMLKHEGGRGKVAFAKSMVGNALAGGAKAAPPLALLAWMYKQWDKEDPEDKLREDYPSLGRVWDVAFEGLPSLGGVYLGGSMEVGFPQTISEAIGVPAAVVTDIVNSVNAWSSGNPGKAIEYLAPLVVARDLLSAWRGATTGERTVGGRPINMPGEVEPAKLSVPEAFEKALGFRPLSTERRWRLSQGLQELNEEHREVQGKFADRYMNAIARDDQDKQAKIIDEIIAYNMIWLAKERPEMVITMDSLSDALNSRMGVRMPPVQMRGKALQRIEGYGLQPSYQE